MCRSVSVCLSRKCTVAKQLMPFGIVSRVGRGMGVLDGGGDVEGVGAGLG